jgi:hypothetical protein
VALEDVAVPAAFVAAVFVTVPEAAAPSADRVSAETVVEVVPSDLNALLQRVHM